jgi:hypothetical protein
LLRLCKVANSEAVPSGNRRWLVSTKQGSPPSPSPSPSACRSPPNRGGNTPSTSDCDADAWLPAVTHRGGSASGCNCGPLAPPRAWAGPPALGMAGGFKTSGWTASFGEPPWQSHHYLNSMRRIAPPVQGRQFGGRAFGEALVAGSPKADACGLREPDFTFCMQVSTRQGRHYAVQL